MQLRDFVHHTPAGILGEVAALALLDGCSSRLTAATGESTSGRIPILKLRFGGR